MVPTELENRAENCNSPDVRYAPACLLALLVVVLAGCGGKKSNANGEASKSADEIVADVRTAIAGAKSVHVVGSGTSSGTKLVLDLTYATGKSGGGTGHVAINGLGFDVARVNGKTYFKGDANFLSQFAGSQAAKLMAGKWFYVANTTGTFASLAALTDLTALTNAIFSTSGTISKGAETKVDGKPVVTLLSKGNGGALYVATTGPAYPLEIKPGGGAGSGTIKFEDWDKSVTLTAPKNPIDYDKLVGKK
jgi:hypothetical protein